MEDDILSLLKNYRPSEAAIAVVSQVPTVLVVGISGAGKDTILTKMHTVGQYHRIVTHTTRAPRPNEIDGKSYHFIDLETSRQMLREHKYIEANYYSKNVYGTSVAEFEQAAKEKSVAIADIDVNGVRNFMNIAPQNIRPVFLVPPSYEVWLERWKKRYGESYTEHLEDLQRRLQTAIVELEHALESHYYFFVVNDDLNEAVAKVNEIAQTGTQNPDEKAEGQAVTQRILTDMQRAVV